jgi:flagellar biosynthesis protein FliR
VLEVFQVAAQWSACRPGFGYASTIDPTSGADSTVLLTLAQSRPGLLFFATGADRLLVRALADSLRLCPPESFTMNHGWAERCQFSGTIFSAGCGWPRPCRAAAAGGWVAGGAGRMQRRLHLVSLTMPVKLARGDAAVASTLVFQPQFFEIHDDVRASG